MEMREQLVLEMKLSVEIWDGNELKLKKVSSNQYFYGF